MAVLSALTPIVATGTPLTLTLASQRTAPQPRRGVCTLQQERGEAITLEATSAAASQVAAPDAHFAMTCRVEGWWAEARAIAASDGTSRSSSGRRGG